MSRRPTAVGLAALVGASLALGPAEGAAQPAPLRVDGRGVIGGRGLDVLVYHNHHGGAFNDEKIGGIELLHHGVRTATNGDVRLSNTPEQWDPTSQLVGRDVDTVAGRVTVRAAHRALGLPYRLEVEPRGGGVLLRVVLDAPLPRALEGRAGFNLEFLPSAYFGRTYLADGRPALFPRSEHGRVARHGLPALEGAAVGGPTSPPELEAVAMATGRLLVLAPEDPERRMTIEALGGASLALYDGRDKAQNGWFVVRTLLPAGRTGTVMEWLVTPNRIPGWTRPPVIAHSQVGYHPAAPKVAILELDPNQTARPEARLLRVGADGAMVERQRARPAPWGRWLRYDYARFDFSAEREPGVYVIEYGDTRSEPFPIAREVYDGVWQPSLDTYLAVQMDHMYVNDRYRVWHGRAHMDDARQAPAGKPHFDLYGMGPATDTRFEDGEHIPGLNVGGWFDAGDFDVRTQSQYAVVSTLVDAHETFGLDWDQTAVDQERRHVELRRPDGVADVLQQIEHGTLALLAQYRAVGHAIPGIVEPTLEQYTHLGDAVTKTDGIAGNADDRWAFTSRNTALDYGSIAALAAASRALRTWRPELAAEALALATRVWDLEHSRPPAAFRVGNTTGGPLEGEELKAAVELLVTTKGDKKYADRLRAMWPGVRQRFDFSAALIVRALPHMDAAFRAEVEQAVRAYKVRADSVAASNPFGVPITTGTWGGVGAVLGFASTGYALHRAFPEIIGTEYTVRGLEYVLGTHPGSSTSLVSGVGARSKTAAYGSNRADFSFIPGGVVPGVVIVRPDFPELKDDWPFLWYESEYVIPAAASFIYVANAARRILQ